MSDCQKAPSAKRCIKTPRRILLASPCLQAVRKHRAPNGALRLSERLFQESDENLRQKAPSAKRCIKTVFYILVQAVG